MRKRNLFTVILVLGLLTACQKAGEAADTIGNGVSEESNEQAAVNEAEKNDGPVVGTAAARSGESEENREMVNEPEGNIVEEGNEEEPAENNAAENNNENPAEWPDNVYAMQLLEEIRPLSEDENGFVESTLVPMCMQPDSKIYFTDDTHFVIIEGGISMDTQEKADEYYQSQKAWMEKAIARGDHVASQVRAHAGDYCDYPYEDGSAHRIRSAGDPNYQNYPWILQQDGCTVLLSRIASENARVYYQGTDGEWSVYPLSGWQDWMEGELEIDSIQLSDSEITVRCRAGEELLERKISLDDKITG